RSSGTEPGLNDCRPDVQVVRPELGVPVNRSWAAGLIAGLVLGGAMVHLGAVRQTPSAQNQQARGRGRGFTEAAPPVFNDHQGHVSIVDGVRLKGWDGNPKFWQVENGAIVSESTTTNPSGNSYIVYRNMEAKDFTLKFEIKIEGDGGSGFQYR